MEHSKYPKTSAFMFIATKNLNKNSYFQSDKAWKNESGSYSIIFSLCLAFSQQYKKSNRGRDIVSYTFSFILAKSKSIWNDFCEFACESNTYHLTLLLQNYNKKRNKIWIIKAR